MRVVRDDVDGAVGGIRARTAVRPEQQRPSSRRVIPSACASRPGPGREAVGSSARGARASARGRGSARAHAAGRPRRSPPAAGDVRAPVQAVRAVDVERARGPNIDPFAPCARGRSGSPRRRARRPRPRRSSRRPRREERPAEQRRARRGRSPRAPPRTSLRVGNSCGARQSLASPRPTARPRARLRPISSRIVSCVRDATTGSAIPSTHTSVRRPLPRSSPVIGSSA